MREALGWLAHRAAGAVLFVGLSVHFYVMHMGGAELTYETVSARLESPPWILFNLVLLLSAIYHGFYGLWGMAGEYVRSARLRRMCGSTILGAASGLTFVGMYILFM
jgi:succinate dehydrogenase / fumarate reductase membrane anchor subunit